MDRIKVVGSMDFGREILKTVPAVSSSTNFIVPPIDSISFLALYRPKPFPELLVVFPLENKSFLNVGNIPGPFGVRS
jgi:hypothetical protein